MYGRNRASVMAHCQLLYFFKYLYASALLGMRLLTSSDNDDQANPLLCGHAGKGALDIVGDTITQDRYDMNYSVHLDPFFCSSVVWLVMWWCL